MREKLIELLMDCDCPYPCKAADYLIEAGVVLEEPNQKNNEPLTIEQLRQMEGVPVYLHTFSSVQKKTNIAQWAIIETVGSSNVVFVRGGCNSRLTKWFCNYGKNWTVYRHKPKEVKG